MSYLGGVTLQADKTMIGINIDQPLRTPVLIINLQKSLPGGYPNDTDQKEQIDIWSSPIAEGYVAFCLSNSAAGRAG
jgi:hypothetical protein